MSERFFLDCPLTPGPVELDGPEAHHLTHVCRMRVGAALSLFNGDGCEYPARVVAVGRRSATLEVAGVLRPGRELPGRLEVAASVPKGDRGQFLIEKLTELGVTTFIPLACQRSIAQPREGRFEKLRRYVVEASKQCGRNVLMNVADTTGWASYCAGATDGVRLLAHPAPDDASARVGTIEPSMTALRLAVGPEGGFTDEEVQRALAAGWRLVDLGPRILRVETAALALAALGNAWLTRRS